MGTITLGSGSTVSSVVIGTRGFMAPEQVAGRSVFSTDLYALGLNQELEQNRIEQERRKLEVAATQARQERQRLEESKKELNTMVDNTVRETFFQPSQAISQSDAYQTITSLYGYLSNKDFNSARLLYSPSLQSSFNSNFFNQFEQVTVENLEVTGSTEDAISLTGSNTYYYPDGTSQKERRSYKVGLINGEEKIIDSKFLKVTRPRK